MLAGPIQTDFSARVKMSRLRRAQNRFMSNNRNFITNIITLEGIENIETKKKNDN